MRTTLDVDEKLVEEAEKVTGEKSPSKAVNSALADYFRLRKLARLRDMLGKLELEDNWSEIEELELREARENAR